MVRWATIGSPLPVYLRIKPGFETAWTMRPVVLRYDGQRFQSITLVPAFRSKTISPLRPVMTFSMLRMSSTGMVK